MDSRKSSLSGSLNADVEVEQIPKRSSLWFASGTSVNLQGVLFDRITAVFSLSLALTSFIVLWPIVSQINFEEAFFTPLVPFLISTLAAFGFSANEAIRILFIVSFMVSTVGIYLLVRDLTKRQVTAILAAVGYLVPPIPIFVLTYLRRGLLEVELASAKSFFTVIYGDGAHFLALALIPFAILSFLRYLKTGFKSYLLTTIIISSLILLANRTQGLNLALVLLICFVTEAFLGKAREKLKRLLIASFISLGLVSFWYTPAFWADSLSTFVKVGVVNIKFLFPLPILLVAFALFFSFVYFARREDRQPIFIAFLAFLVFLGISGEWIISGRVFMPHPHRLLSNLNMFGAIVMALTLAAIVDELAIVKKIGLDRWSASARTLAALGFGVFSLTILTIATYTLSPLAILALSGPKGVWTQLRMSVLADRQETLAIAGGNFKLVHVVAGQFQMVIGLVLSIIFLILLLTILFKNGLSEEE